MSCMTCGCSTLPCGCCSGMRRVTPVAIDNRPGLDAISCRVGTHGQFFETMIARLPTLELDAPGPDGQTIQTWRPLQGLTTRDRSDPSIALLDCWAVVGGVLTFYQERIANEGYLRTCTERSSVVELARLIGYEARPGVASSVYLSYTIDESHTVPTVIPAGARAQTIPGPGELPQSFETSEPLEARAEWNVLQPRLTRPQVFSLLHGTQPDVTLDRKKSAMTVYLAGTDSNLRPGDRLLFLFSSTDLSKFVLRTVARTDVDYTAKRTQVDLQPLAPPETATASSTAPAFDFVQSLLIPARAQVANSLRLSRSLEQGFLGTPNVALRALGTGVGSPDANSQLLVDFSPRLRESYYKAWAAEQTSTQQPPLAGLFAMRASLGLFGSGAGAPPLKSDGTRANGDWPLSGAEKSDIAYLEQADEAIAPGSYVIIGKADSPLQLLKVKSAQTRPRTDYGISSKTTALTLSGPWWKPPDSGGEVMLEAATSPDTIATLRSTQVYARSEALHLADAPIADDLYDQTIELTGLYRELQSGRWIIVSGERGDITGVSGVISTELLMISAVSHGFDPALPGDQVHTTLTLATPTAYKYKRQTVSVFGNVVKATHGETRNEVLGSGSGTSLQSFALRQRPLTYISAPTAAGAASSLHLFVNGVEWHEVDAIAGLGPTDRDFVTRTDDSGVTTVLFGDGEQGARPPTGAENVTAIYRTGIGLPGNVRAQQIKLLQTKPLGVKDVVNPLPGSGGADRETRDQARQNAPLAVMALDRLVSVQDYSDFARTFAGVAKAIAQRVTDGCSEVICLTIAEAGDTELDVNSDLYRNLLAAFVTFGDADLPVKLLGRERVALLLSAGIKLKADYQWELVVAAVRAQLLDRFGFERRQLGQAAILSEIVAVMSAVPGVDYVDVDVFTGIPDHRTDEHGVRTLQTPDQIAQTVQEVLLTGSLKLVRLDGQLQCPSVAAFPGGFDQGALRPAQLAIFTPAVPQTLVLNQIT